SWAAATAATRPLIVAEPMLRIPRPEITPWSKVAGFAGEAGACAIAEEASAAPMLSASKVMERCMAFSVSAFGRGGRREGENAGVDRFVEFRRFDVDLALLEREVHAIDFFVFAQVGRLHLLLAAHHAMVDDADLEELVRVEIDHAAVAVLEGHAQLVRIGAVDVLGAEVFDLFAFLLRIQQRAGDVGGHGEILGVVAAEFLRITAALEWIDGPALRAIPRIHLGQSLQRQLEADLVGSQRKALGLRLQAAAQAQ